MRRARSWTCATSSCASWRWRSSTSSSLRPVPPRIAVVVAVGGREALLEVAQQRVVEAHLVGVERALRLELGREEARQQPAHETAEASAGRCAGRPRRVHGARVGRCRVSATRVHPGASHSTIRRGRREAARRRARGAAPAARGRGSLLRRRRSPSSTRRRPSRFPRRPAPEIRELLAELNELWTPAEARAAPASARRSSAAPGTRSRPRVERQARFNAVLVRLVNAQREHAARYHARLRELGAARGRATPSAWSRWSTRATTCASRARPARPPRCSRSSPAGSRRWASGSRACSRCATAPRRSPRRCGRCARGSPRRRRRRRRPVPRRARPRTRPTPPSRTASAARARRCARRQADYVELLRGHAPVVDLGCGRGELLELLRDAGIAARGVEGNANAVQECRAKGLDVAQGDLVEFLERQPPGCHGRRLRGAGGRAPRAARGSRRCSRRRTGRSPRTGCWCSRR